MNGDREIVPGAYAFIRKMIYTRMPCRCLDDREDRPCQVGCVGRRTDLVEDHTEFVFLLPQTDHRLHEVIAVRRVEPCRTQDHRFGARCQQVLLAHVFGAAVRRTRCYRVALAARHVLVAGEHIIGADVDHPHTLTA